MYTCIWCNEEKPDVVMVNSTLAKTALCDDCCERILGIIEERVARRDAEREVPND